METASDQDINGVRSRSSHTPAHPARVDNYFLNDTNCSTEKLEASLELLMRTIKRILK